MKLAKMAPAAPAARTTPRAALDETQRRRRDGLGLLQALSIAEAWSLTQHELAVLLGTSVRTLQRWKVEASENRALEVTADTAERMSYLLGIWKALAILFPTPANRVHWLRHPNAGAPFNGQAPLTRLLAGRVADLYHVRHVLDGARG